MGVEDVDTAGSATTVTDYGLGARGIDWISATKSGTTTTGFPLYDAHGNMTGCLFRGTGGSYTVGNRRSYDAWGLVRQGSGSGDPKGRYCANLGHKVDDESGLIYMRARYYEPGSGRFVSEDPNRSGTNWLTYAGDQPVTRRDENGADWVSDQLLFCAAAAELWTVALDYSPAFRALAWSACAFFQDLVDMTSAFPAGMQDKANKQGLVATLTTANFEAQGWPLATASPAAQAAALAAGYSDAIWITGFLLGLWGPQGPWLN